MIQKFNSKIRKNTYSTLEALKQSIPVITLQNVLFIYHTFWSWKKEHEDTEVYVN